MTAFSQALHEAQRRKIHADLDRVLRDLIALDAVLPAQILFELEARGAAYNVEISIKKKV
jgi:hypothetical protein